MSLSLRLARRSVVSVGLRSTATPRLLSTLSAARRPQLSPTSSPLILSTPLHGQRRNISNESNAAAAASQVSQTSQAGTANDIASAIDLATSASASATAAGNESFLTTAWEAAKTVAMFPSNFVTEALINIPTPSYLLSIFVLAYLLRSTITFPVQLWQRRRIERLQTRVNPLLKGLNDQIAFSTLVEAKREGWGHGAYVEAVKKRMADAVYALHKKHKTHPWVTLLAPAAVNIPLLIAASWGVRNALVQSPEIANSTALWFSSFGEPDSNGILPIATGVLAYANVEIIKRAQEIRKRLHKLPPVPSTSPPDALESSSLPVSSASASSAASAVSTASAASTASTASTTSAASSTASTSSASSAPASTTTTPRVSPHRPGIPPSRHESITKRHLSETSPANNMKGRPRRRSGIYANRKPVSQIPDETRGTGLTPHGQPPQQPQPKLRKKGKVVAPGAEDMESVTKGGIWQSAMKDRERMNRGITNFMSVVAIGIVPVGLWTPALVVSYWFASMSFTAIQTSAFAYIDNKELKARLAAQEEIAQRSLQQKEAQRAEIEARRR